MSQGQQRRPGSEQLDPIKYGDVFNISGELASKLITPGDAATMQAAESLLLGEIQKGGPAAVMHSAATYNQRAGLVGHHDVDNDSTEEEGVTISESIDLDGNRVVTERVAGHVLGQYVEPPLPAFMGVSGGSVCDEDSITIGEALEATALSAADKPIEQSDVAAIQEAEMRATGKGDISPGGLAAMAQYAASANAREMESRKTKLADVLDDATQKMGGDKPVTREDAKAIIGAEMRNKPDMSTTPGGVAEGMAAAARLNQKI